MVTKTRTVDIAALVDSLTDRIDALNDLREQDQETIKELSRQIKAGEDLYQTMWAPLLPRPTLEGMDITARVERLERHVL